ncbi:MAG: DinB family protein [Acidobacteria bacterium]|nr:DinB family protein [Acidobacteriota bacterium]
MALKDSLLADFDHEMGTTRRLLERLPDDRLSWKPHEKSMSLGALATHLCNIPHWGGTILNEAFFDLRASPPNREEQASRADILSSFDEAVKRTRASMDQTDAELASLWSLRRGDQEMFTLPRIAAFRSFVLHHIIHHRGQLSVYLRLNDIPVPAIYGPSADEG